MMIDLFDEASWDEVKDSMEQLKEVSPKRFRSLAWIFLKMTTEQAIQATVEQQ